MQIRYLLSLACLIACSACTVKDAVENLKPTRFIENPEILEPPKNTPFDLAWMSPNVPTWQYDTLVVEAVRTDQIDTDNWIYSAGTFIPTKEIYNRRVNELAEYIQQSLTMRFENYGRPRTPIEIEKGLPLVSGSTGIIELPTDADLVPKIPIELAIPESRTLKVELSIAEANFGDPLIYGGLLAVPVPAAANLSTALKSPSLTLEAKFRDGKTGEVLTELVDRRFPQVKVIDVNRLTVASALHEIADSFAEDLVASFYRKKGEKVGKRWPFSLVPW